MRTNMNNPIALKQELSTLAEESKQLQATVKSESRDMNGAEMRRGLEITQRSLEIHEALSRIDSVRNQALREARGGGGSGADTDERRLDEYMAEEFRALSEGGQGSTLVPLDYSPIMFDRLAAQAIGLKSGATVIQTNRETFHLPHLTADAAAAWVAEGAAFSETDPTVATISVTPTKLGVLTVTSRELVDDATPDVAAMLRANLMRSMGLAFDLAFFEGTGSSNQPTGLKNTGSITTDATSMGTDGSTFTTAGNIDAILNAIGTLEQNNARATAIAMHPRTWQEISTLKATTGQYLYIGNGVSPSGEQVNTLAGVPVYLSSQLSITETQGAHSDASSVYVYQADQVVVVQNRGFRLEVSNDAYFANDQIGFRAVGRFGIAVPNPKSVVRIAGVR